MSPLKKGALRPVLGPIFRTRGLVLELFSVESMTSTSLTPEGLQALIAQGEGQRLEFKRSLAELETGVRSVTAMANSDGGYVLFGVRDDGRVLGVEIGTQTRERVVQAITDNTDPTLYPIVAYVDVGGRTVIAVTVSNSDNKPHLVRGRAYKRVGTADVQMRRAEYERLLLQRQEVEFDCQLVKGATYADLDEAKLEMTNAMYQELFEVSRRTATRDLRTLVRTGWVRQKGTRKGTRYVAE